MAPANNMDKENEFNPGDKSRITKVGSFLRRTKLDELPELFNVLKGDMSIVGPRPEVKRLTQRYKNEFKEILRLRPGLSDYASIKYRNEEDILSRKREPEKYYLEVILPDKINLVKKYSKDISFSTDILIVLRTIKKIMENLF
jgi:lipopolysaccharide/colanic/teichoic acid biosynthesis glycosyltransferase